MTESREAEPLFLRLLGGRFAALPPTLSHSTNPRLS